MQNTQI